MSVFDRVRQTYCGLHGHDSLLQFRQDRMYLKCVSCGHETPGWEIKEAQAAVTPQPDVRRPAPAMVRSPLVGARRVA